MNYLKLKCYNIFRYEYLYIDTEEFLADTLFNEYKIKNIKFKEHYAHPDYKGYRAIICRIRKCDEKNFLHCMDLLNTKATILNGNKYLDMCKFVMQSLLDIKLKKGEK